jgi:hypothetical protein
MDYFFHTPREIDGKKLKIIYGGFWCDIMNICNEKLIHMMLKTNYGK